MTSLSPSKLLAKALSAVGIDQGLPASNLKRDEELVFFNTTAWLDEETNEWNIPIHGWVYEPQSNWPLRTFVAELLDRKYGLKTTSDTKERFKRRFDLFTVDNERRKKIIIDLNDQLYELPKSEPNGQFEGIIKIANKKASLPKTEMISFDAVLKASDSRKYKGAVSLIQPSGVSVISDIDDTIKRSYINDRKRMFDSAFFQAFEAVKGMPELYQQWAEQGAKFHFVSSSPWQLYQPLQEFVDEFKFPWASFSLKKVRIKDETFLNLFKSGLVTKPIAIRSIMQRYPNRKFILVGDSGEQDAQAYAQIASEFPEQVIKIYIRNVHADKTLNKRYESIFKGLNRRKWSTFIYPSQIKLNIEKLA